jgi:hypothetical protein
MKPPGQCRGVRQEEDKQENYFSLFKFLLFTLMFVAVLVAQVRHPHQSSRLNSSTRLLVESSERAAQRPGVRVWSAAWVSVRRGRGRFIAAACARLVPCGAGHSGLLA